MGKILEVADDCRGLGVVTPHPHSDCPSSRLTFKTHTVLTRSIPQISIMIHQLLFAKNITQIARRMKLLESNLRWNVSPFPGNVITRDNDGSDPLCLPQSAGRNERREPFLCVQASITAITSILGIKPIFNAPFDKNT